MPDLEPAARSTRPDARLRHLFDEHFDFIWRALRRFGLTADRADDAAQRVFFVASERLADIRPGSERSFLIGTAIRVAAQDRRTAATSRLVLPDDLPDVADAAPLADELLVRQQKRALLDQILDSMDTDLRVVFVLFELEELTTPEIASLLNIPPGTAASRLRRARDEFQETVKRMKARGMIPEGAV